MNQYIAFALNHWMLSGLVIILLIALIQHEREGAAGGTAGISPQDAVLLINHQRGLVLDLRDAESFKKGHIVESLHLLPENLEKELQELIKFKERPIILVAGRSQPIASIVQRLKKAEFSQVKQLVGGVDAWRNAGIPLVKNE